MNIQQLVVEHLQLQEKADCTVLMAGNVFELWVTTEKKMTQYYGKIENTTVIIKKMMTVEIDDGRKISGYWNISFFKDTLKQQKREMILKNLNN